MDKNKCPKMDFGFSIGGKKERIFGSLSRFLKYISGVFIIKKETFDNTGDIVAQGRTITAKEKTSDTKLF